MRLRTFTAGDPDVIERFKREIHLARQVAHPNVSRIFDLGYHQTGPEPGARVTFLTMELLEGETLTEFIRRKKRVSPEEALPLVRQMSAALHAAHEAGIVHRDFKGGNVILVPSSKVRDDHRRPSVPGRDPARSGSQTPEGASRSLSDSRRHLEAAARAAEKATRQGALHLVARARFEEGVAYQNLAEAGKSRERLEEAKRMFAGTEDRRGVAASMCNIGLLGLNEPAKALKTFQESLAIYRELGNMSGIALMQGNVGNARYGLGDLEGAKHAWRETLATYRQIDEKGGMARMPPPRRRLRPRS